MTDNAIPRHVAGKQNDLEHTVTCANEADAHLKYVAACDRMLDPGCWHELAGKLSGKFVLTDAGGNEVHRRAQQGDLIKIDIPGPGPKEGEGYDWVQVELTEQGAFRANDEESCAMRLRPTGNPNTAGEETAHFFKTSATSTFIIRRIGTEVTASYHGRNEVPNVATDKAIDNVRNAIITSGALAGLSEVQWGVLIKAFVE